jgi:lipooligosaccharide transport system permease protein
MATPAAVRVWGSGFALYKRIWRSNLIGSVLQPLLYLLGMGVGVGALVDRGTRATEVLGGVDYAAFLAPALMASTAMIVVSQEAMWPVLDGFLWNRGFHSMAATPLTSTDIAAGVALWHATRGFIAAAGVAVVLAIVPDTRSWGLLPAIPFAVLTGMAVSGPISAWSSTREVPDQTFAAIQRFVIIPMFLFAGAFYPIDQLPGWLRPVAEVTPLYHGVQLCRGAALGTLGIGAAVVHVVALLAFWGVGFALCRRAFVRRLAQ